MKTMLAVGIAIGLLVACAAGEDRYALFSKEAVKLRDNCAKLGGTLTTTIEITSFGQSSTASCSFKPLIQG